MDTKGGPPRALTRLRVPTRLLSWVRRHQHTAASLLFAGLVLVYLWPALIGGKVLSPATILYEFVPWQGQGLPDRAAYYNRLLTDVAQAFYPWNVLARDYIRSGVFPAWSQHAFAGTPFYGNPQTALLSPFSLPLWILPLTYALGLVAALKLWVAAFGSYLLVRELNLGFWPGVLAGVAYAFCAFNIVWLSYETLPAVAAVLPWMLWLVERTMSTGSLVAPLALVLPTFVALTSGHPGTEVHVMLAVGLYGIVRACFVQDVAMRARVRRLGLMFGGVMLGAMLAAVVLIPEIHSASGAAGVAARKGGTGNLPGTQLPLAAIRSAVFPDWWGRPSDGLLSGPANYNERTYFAGSVALMLAMLSLTVVRGWRRKLPFALLGVLGLAVPLHTPLYSLVEHLPLLDNVQNQRMLLYFAIAVAVLSAFGFEQLLDRDTGRWRVWGVLGVAAGIGVLAIRSAGRVDLGNSVAEAFGTARHQAAGVLVMASALWWLALVAGVAMCAVIARRYAARLSVVAAAIVLLASIDMFHFAAGYEPMGPSRGVFPPRTPAIAYLQRHRNEGRFVGLGDALLNDWGALHGLRDVRGYDPPQPSSRFLRLWRLVTPMQTSWGPFEVTDLDARGQRVMSLLGARYWITAPGIGVPPELRHDVTIGYSGRDATVLVNARATPRAFVATYVKVVRGENDALATIAGPSFDPRREAVAEEGARAATVDAGLSARSPPGTVRVTAETNAMVLLRADMRRRGLVVLDDALAPGWSVSIDGHPGAVVRTDDVLRGVVVSRGRHEITWSYRVPGLRLGIIVTTLGLIAVLTAGHALLRSRRAYRKPSRLLASGRRRRCRAGHD